MRHFACRDVEAAQDYADAGGQALHTHQIIVNRAKAPRCFREEVDAGRDIAHLFDRDSTRLAATAKRLGVRVLVIERWGRRGQHIDLCKGPLYRALAECRATTKAEAMPLFGR